MSCSRVVCAGWMVVCLWAAGCKEKQPENLAPVASALVSAPKPAEAIKLTIDKASSKLEFLMEAPIEKISGEADAAVEGELFVDTADLSKSTGLVRADLNKLVLYQEKREDEKGQFGARAKNDLQNQHARNWLEISDDVPEQTRADNANVEYRISRLENPSINDLSRAPGTERKVTATAVGDFRLHGRKNEKRAKIELIFTYANDKLASVRVSSLEALPIGLDEFDVRPREAFGKLAQKTLSALGSKVAQSAPIRVSFTARAE
ncbi:MAG TPA: hypothetical protein VFQ61_01500 [Polyangiaceae bacterium]|nr:hypothetical protein [Polyangiaceae bacterium]